MSTKRISTLMALVALACFAPGCANRFQQSADKSLLIQENLQLDQALNITQYELMLARQENDALRRQLEQSSQNGSGATSGGGVSGGRLPPLRSTYDSGNGAGAAPSFEANDPNLPAPTNQMPNKFMRQPGQPAIAPPQPATVPDTQARATQYVDVPPNAPQWSPQRYR